MIKTPSNRMPIPEMLRAIGCFLVMFHHFTCVRGFLPEGWLKQVTAHGWIGVELAFIVSGFVVPYALLKSGYRISDYGAFLSKRALRLEPPYLISLVLVIALGFVSAAMPGYRGNPYDITWPQVAAHLACLNVFIGYDWLSPVYWTLAIELQFYLMMGLLFWAVSSRSRVIRNGAFALLALLSLLSDDRHFLPVWVYVFMLGMVVFQYRTGLTRLPEYLLWLVLSTAGVWLTRSPLAAVVGVAATLVVTFGSFNVPRVILFLARISYSLFLIHVPIGSRIINFSMHYIDAYPLRLVVLATAIGASIAAAWLLHIGVEVPAQRWASAIKYGRRAREERMDSPAEPA